MKPLLARKQMLVAASELNRAALLNDVATLGHTVNALTERARSFGTLAAAAGQLLAALTKGGSAPSSNKMSWLPKVLKGAELVTNLWRMFRPQRQGPASK